jgi:nucleoside-diphosphate-sugar epimerase
VSIETPLAGARVLVTGGSGFLAANLLPRLFDLNCSVLVATRQSKSPSSARVLRKGTIRYLGAELDRAPFWIDVVQEIDFVFHFAAQTSVYVADDNPYEDWRANVEPMIHLLAACRARDQRPAILFAGSVTQAGIPDRLPVNETHPDRPVTIYDWHKLLAEGYLEHYVRNGWAHGATLRLANIYGPGPSSGAGDRGVLNQIMRRALRNDPLTLYGEGRQVRDYLFVDDAIEAFLAAAANVGGVNGRHFVVATGEGHTLAEAFHLIAARAKELTGRDVAVRSIDPPAGLSPIEDRSFVGDVTAFRQETNWIARTSLQQGIDMTLQAFAADTAKEIG